MNGLNGNKPYGFGVLIGLGGDQDKTAISNALVGILNGNGCDTKLWYDQSPKFPNPKTEEGEEYLLLRPTRSGCKENYSDIVAQFNSEHPEFVDKVFVVEKDPVDAYRGCPVELPENRVF